MLGVILCLTVFLLIIGVILLGVGIFLFLRAPKTVGDAQIDAWTDEDLERHDFVARARAHANFAEVVRDPVVLFGLASEEVSNGLIEGERVGDDARTRNTPLGVTVLLCSPDQLGIYQCAVDLITGNIANERFFEVFYQDVATINLVQRTDTLELKSAAEALRSSVNISAAQRSRGLTHAKLLQKLNQLKERYRAYIVNDVLQRDLVKDYRIELSTGRVVSVPISDGRATAEVTGKSDMIGEDQVAQAMVALRNFVRDKKRQLVHEQPGGASASQSGGELY